MAWQLAAQGTSFSELNQLIADRTLNKGDRVRVVMDCPGYAWLFDAAGAEIAFMPLKPEGMDIIDVWGEGGKGYVEMEADPAQLVAVLGAIAYWGAIAIALGIVLFIIVSLIKVFVWGPTSAAVPIALIVGIALGAAGLLYLGKKSGGRSP